MTQQAQAAARSHPAFRLVRTAAIDSLNVNVEHYEHRATGAAHYHLAADNPENVFLVALRTVPEDSTGVAHILEHTALCGSERYPVRDPFFMMLRRSLNTFMNAFTSSDWTAYPFASQNRKDFDNLLGVYLDAVFFSRLDPLDFAQEGHRVEFSDPADSGSELVFKGVVFNEMKGAMSSVTSTLWNTLCEHLFPTSTYHHNSGGDPVRIPDLSYEQLVDFYRSHYHPSNAIFMTFGDIPAADLQASFEERALSRFEALPERIAVSPEQRLPAPVEVQAGYAFDEPGALEKRTHIVLGWMLGESSDLEALLEAQLLSSVLIDNSASPLMQLLETTELGQAPSPLCGLEDSMREMVFCCGVEGSEAEHAAALEAAVLAVIQDVATQGVPQERLEAVLHQLELHQREISGDSYPYGLQLILQSLGAATHYADPIAVLDLDPVIERLRERIKDPDYIRRLAQTLLLDNTHRVRLVLTPDRELSGQRDADEQSRLAAMLSDMDEAEKQAVVELAASLLQRQAQEDDESILPKVELSDVAEQLPELSPRIDNRDGLKNTGYAQGTNGLVYRQAILPLSRLDDQQLALLPLYTNALTELGLGDEDYLATQHRQAATVGSINCFTSMRGAIDDEQAVKANLVLSSKALLRNSQAQAQLMYDTLYAIDFGETQRLRDLVSQQRARREQALTGNGHGLAMAAASAGMSPLAALNHHLSGLEGIRALRALDDSLAEPAALDKLGDTLAGLHAQCIAQSPQLLTVAEDASLESLMAQSASVWSAMAPASPPALFEPSPVRERVTQLWLANTQVNFCARAYPTVPVGHPDAPALVVLGGYLRNGYLHRAIREQGGAYGGGASQDSSIAAFRFYSYRDPRLEETLADFDACLDWLQAGNHEARALEEAILGVIGSLDKPSSPAGEAKQHFHNTLFGRTHAQREAFRRAVLDVSEDDLKRVAQTYLQPERASTAVLTSATNPDDKAARAEALGLMLETL
ncbi:MAG: insulinase family protein [Pseudomonadota bacterium]